MNNFRDIVISLCSVLYFASSTNIPAYGQMKIGEVFPSWSQGYLDIHHINAGKGESTLFIMPDGTTMLVDAGATTRPKPRVTDQRPDASRTPGEWISRYIMHIMKDLPSRKLDYILLTHFDGDHIGDYFPGAKTSKTGAYKLTGITEVGEHILFGKLVDRGWPDYNWPVPMENEKMKNYRQFLNWNVERNNSVVERFRAGQNTQFVLVNNRQKYPDFEIRNIAVNGHVWTGVGTNERNHFPALESLERSQYPGENMCSIAFRLSYGKFDYFNGGDLTGAEFGSWRDIETQAGMVTGPVEVCEVNHHAHYDAMEAPFIRAVRPRVFILQTWAPSHPASVVLSRMLSNSVYPGPRDIFATNVMEETKVVIGSGIDAFKSQQGHIVIRVNPGGENFMIYILDDSAENFRIRSIHGPYSCD
jgi:beta-lactamase superfamily II metal-dependent hydrolase